MDDPIAGEIRLAAFDQIPAGWASCDGQLLQIADYRALYDVIGTRYGGDGRRTFALPDLRGRLALHADANFPLGATGGRASHALTVNE
ncbi:MAG TPA: tail fiber protein, partial [Thermomicrobiales bacterium]|nr:tail fiber protein [Thermomicrobiales bacterium]